MFAFSVGAASLASLTLLFRGVLKAPVLCRWSFSNISCSAFGRRGGAGPEPKGDCKARGEVLNARRESCLGRRARERMVEVIILDGDRIAIALFDSYLCYVTVTVTSRCLSRVEGKDDLQQSKTGRVSRGLRNQSEPAVATEVI